MFFAEGKVVIQGQFLPTANRAERAVKPGPDQRNIRVGRVVQVLLQAQGVQPMSRQPVKATVVLAKVLKQTTSCSGQVSQ